MAEDVDKLIAWACSQGWTVTVDANGYRRFHTPDGSYVTRYPEQPATAPARCSDRGARTWPAVAPAVEEGTTLPAQEGGPAVSKWIAKVTVATPAPLEEQHLITLDEAAERWDATVANRADGHGFALTIELDERDTIAAARTAAHFIHTVLGKATTGQVIDLRVCTPEQFETEALRPDFPPLASAADVAEILGVSRQRVHQLAASNTRFPAPVARVGTGPLWTVPAIEHFARIWERRPGRPAARVG